MLVSLIALILSLLLVIGLHEAGHALAAYFLGIKIKRIAIGFGPPLIKWTNKNKVEWVWGLLPLGGYVELLNTRIGIVKKSEEKYAFDKQAIWKRITVLVAGVATNFFIAFVALIIIHVMGYQRLAPVISEVDPASIAAQAQIAAGDRFLAINNKSTPSWREAGLQLLISLGQNEVPVELITSTGEGKKTMLHLNRWHYQKDENLLKSIGIIVLPSEKPEIVPGINLLQAMIKAAQEIQNLVIFFILLLKQIVTGTLPFALLLGPIGIFSLIINSLEQGFLVFLNFIANLSISVAVVNILPIPGLDGGGILYALLEKIRGKPLSIALEILIFRLMCIFFILFTIQLILNDLNRYFA
ncbi:membrane associated zinc metalloprotease (plasmid) [Legionella adelaidensis]|uniref:Membrane associated zinc metalloprotease n=1 Tax=Legionella adelaidensis TaxID=45056 RepID=A0A0W0R2V7_9GAMM|nr:site-2 protease family protein [Legionella adelaidensis]KTC65400.1 membrane associated zinc metalloprotease [Legionella adelaidensis]VEH84778.1 membrane associated zinc metalloprotease [Legionella adelaidensis]